jgi:hypothetical protein
MKSTDSGGLGRTRIVSPLENKHCPNVVAVIEVHGTRFTFVVLVIEAERVFIGLLIFFLFFSPIAALEGRTPATIRAGELTRNIPARAIWALTGWQFTQYVSRMDPKQREQSIEDQILEGNLPPFLRKLVPVELRGESTTGRKLIATIFVTPDYLAIGSDDDFLRIPMNLHTAIAIADRFGFILPTKKMVDAIYLQSGVHFPPQPLPAGPQMRSTEYYWTHNQMIQEEAETLGVRLGILVSGHKKDIVISNLLTKNVGRVAIYGWHRAPGEPIQPLSTFHGANYADYSHGVRLVSAMALINGQPRSIYEILRDPSTASVLSDEGPILNIRGLFSLRQGLLTSEVTSTN